VPYSAPHLMRSLRDSSHSTMLRKTFADPTPLVSHEFLQDETIENSLSLSRIAEVFTAPPASNSLDSIASLLGVIFYFIVRTSFHPPHLVY